jgi:hypothetical protein
MVSSLIIDNMFSISVESEIKDKHFGDQVTFYTIRPGHDNMENKNLVIGEFSAPKWIDRNRINELVKETVSKYVTTEPGPMTIRLPLKKNMYWDLRICQIWGYRWGMATWFVENS